MLKRASIFYKIKNITSEDIFKSKLSPRDKRVDLNSLIEKLGESKDVSTRVKTYKQIVSTLSSLDDF